MEGYSGEDSAAESKDDGKEKKVSKAAGLGGRSFELAKKTDAAEKLADASSIWEKLIPKEGSNKSAEQASTEPTLESFKVEKTETDPEASVEEAEDASIEVLSENEKAVVVKDYAQEKVAELEAGRNDAEAPAEAAAREANIEYLRQVEQENGVVPSESVEAPGEVREGNPEAIEDRSADDEVMPAEFADDEAIELNPAEAPRSVEDELALQYPPAAAVLTPRATTQPPLPPAAVTPNAFGPASFDAAPQAVMTPEADWLAQERAERANEASFFFAGGVLGYLLGRRRGRIKTEKRMRAVTKKLEAQIANTRDQVARQEVIVRQQARDSYNASHGEGAEATAARVMATRPPETLTEGAERRPVLSPAQAAAAERVQHMEHHEVLAIAEKVVVDGTSLRKIYEAKQITEPGLRRLTREYLRGGNLKATLQHELAVKQMQYERDPQMRDRLAASYADVEAARPMTASEGMASLLAHGTSENAARMHQNVQQAAAESEQAKKSHAKQILVGTWATIVFILVIVAVVLAAR